MDAHQTQGCIVQQMDAYMGFAGLKTVKKLHCHSVLFCFFRGPFRDYCSKFLKQIVKLLLGDLSPLGGTVEVMFSKPL